jgi:hypothetical protein
MSEPFVVTLKEINTAIRIVYANSAEEAQNIMEAAFNEGNVAFYGSPQLETDAMPASQNEISAFIEIS